MTAPTVNDVSNGKLTTSPLNGITSGVRYAINPPACIAKRTTAQSIANNATAPFATITFDTEEFDNQGMFAASSDTITIAGAGVYDLQAAVSFTSNATGVRAAFITVSGTNVVESSTSAISGGDTQLSVSTSVVCVAGDTIKLNVWQTSGGALNTATTPQPRLAVCRRSGT